MDRYYFLEIIRDSNTYNLVGATLIYNSNGRTLKHTTTNEAELKNILYNYERQSGMTHDGLVYYGHIVETTNEKIRNGQYQARDVMGYHFPNLSSFERIRRTERYGTNINWVDRVPEKNYGQRIINLPSLGKIKIKPLLLSLLVAGSIGIGAHKVNEYTSTYNEHVQTINYKDNDLFWNYGDFDDIFTKLANGWYDEVNQDELSEVIGRIGEFYQPNMAAWRQEYIEGRPKFSGVCYSFASYFKENTFDNVALGYIENKYNFAVSNYAYTLDGGLSYRYVTNQLENLCDELYNFIYRNGFLSGTMIKYSELSPLAQLIIIEIFDNCVKTVEYKVDESHLRFSQQRGYQTVTHEQVVSKNEEEKNKIVSNLNEFVDVNSKNTK